METNTLRNPLVSVALATYNGERFLRGQIDSILSQTYKPIEIIACDDASTDATRDILENYAVRGLIELHKNETRLGLTGNFEKALSLCRGEFMALCDQDDLWHPEKIEVLLGLIGNRLMIHSDAELIDAFGTVTHASYTRYANKKVNTTDFAKILTKNVVTGCTTLFRRELFDSARPFPFHVPQDHWLSIIAASRNGIVYCERPLVQYRQHDANLIGAKEYRKDTPFLSEDTRNFGFFSSARRRNHYVKFRIYSEIEKALQEICDSKHLNIVKDLKEYYSSYLTKRLRIRAFLINIKHFSVLNQGFSGIRKLKRVFYSLLGEGMGNTFDKKNPEI